MKRTGFLAVGYASAMLALGCSAGITKSPEDRPAKGELVVTVGGVELNATVALITIEQGEKGVRSVDIAINAIGHNDSWDLAVAASPEFLDTKALDDIPVRAELMEGALGGSVYRSVADGREQGAKAGTVSLTIARGMLEGSVVGAGPTHDATFVGPYTVQCFVTPDGLPDAKTPAPKPEDPSASVLVLDSELKSDFCAPYAAL